MYAFFMNEYGRDLANPPINARRSSYLVKSANTEEFRRN
jgi:hypothetical protein